MSDKSHAADDRLERAFVAARSTGGWRRALGVTGHEFDPAAQFDRLNGIINRHVRGDLARARRLADALCRWVEAERFSQLQPLAWRAAGRSRIASGRSGEAIDFYRRARDTHRRRSEAGEVAKIDRVLVDCHMYLGEYRKSLAAGRRAAKYFEAVGSDIDLGMTLVNVGNVYHRRDDHRRALEHYDRAATLLKESGNPVFIARVDFNRANTLANLGREAESIELYDACAKIYAEAGLELAAAQCRYSAAYSRFLIGDYSRAMEGLTQARDEYRRLGDEAGAALCDLDIAELAGDLNLIEEGIESARRAHRAFGRLGRHYEQTKARLFDLILQLRDGAFSPRLARQLFDDFRREKNPMYIGVIDALRAERDAVSGRFSDARKLAARAGSRFDRLGAIDRASAARLVAARAALATGNRAASEKLTDRVGKQLVGRNRPRVAYRYHHWKGRLAWSARDENAAIEHFAAARKAVEELSQGVFPDDMKPYFWEDKRAIYLDLADVLLRRDDPQSWIAAAHCLDDARVRTLTEQLEAGERQEAEMAVGHRRLERDRRRGRPTASGPGRRGGSRPRAQRRETLDVLDRRARRLRRSLKGDAAVVSYHLGRDQSTAIVMDARTVDRVPLKATRDDVTRAVRRLRLEMDGAVYDNAAAANRCNDVVRRISDMVWSPLREVVEGRPVSIVPDGALWGAPFHAFALIGNSNSVLPCMAVSLQHLASRESVGKRTIDQRAYDDKTSDSALFVAPHPDRLPATRRESRVFQAAFPNGQRLWKDAAEIAPTLQAASRARLVHIAAHAHFRWDNPLFSGLEFADGLLTLARIASQRRQTGPWRAELVVLSGCGTGLSRSVGGEEFVGLGRGFLANGVRRLLVSLWDIDDQTTGTWMRYFYQAFADCGDWDRSWESAVKRARTKWRHPFHWAPFALLN